jgi:sodium pump decarboxylase gamma subunit
MWIGAELTVYGMGLVFLLLAVLWGLIAVMIRLDQPETSSEAPEDEVVETPAAADAAALEANPARAAAVDGLSPEVLAAVVIACRAHRMARRKQAAPEMRTHQPGSLPSRWIGAGRTRQNRSWAPGGRFA